MGKLLKYLRPYKYTLIIVFIVLFGQAMCDLCLPGYMSGIVNIGIQQSGVEHASPPVISREGLRLMKVFMSPLERIKVSDRYVLGFDAGIDSARTPIIRNGSAPQGEEARVYFLDSRVDEQTRAELDVIFSNATWTLINIMKEYRAQTGQALPSGEAGEFGVQDIEIAQLYAMQSTWELAPPELISEARDAALALDEPLRLQTGAFMAGVFHTELGGSLAQLQSNYILRTGMTMLIISILGGLAAILVGFLVTRLSAGMARKLRRKIFVKVQSFSNDEMDKFSVSTLITRSTNDITQMQNTLMIGIRMVFFAPIMAVGGIVMAINKSPSMSWVIALACILIALLMVITFSVTLPKFKSLQKLTDKVNLVAREHLSGTMVIRAFGTRFFEKRRFDRANTELTDTYLFIGRTMSAMMPLMMMLTNLITLLIVWVGAKHIAASEIQIGDMMAFMQYALQIIMSFMFISMLFMFLPRAAVSAERIDEVLTTESSIRDLEAWELRPEMRGVVSFKDVSFRYHNADTDALSGITFTALPGQTTAIIGPTGAGKSTLLNLILRYYEVTGGAVEVCGIDVRKCTQAELRSVIGYVPQKGVLMSGTIASNLKYADENASFEDIRAAAEIAQALPFIEAKPKQFDDEIAQGGANVSGGQKQRLSIARALVKKAPIYVFDDCFSALDFQTDSDLRRALKANMAEATLIIVAQRVSTIMNADQIIVLDEGKIVGRGTHGQLMKNCLEYREIAESQITSGEVG